MRSKMTKGGWKKGKQQKNSHLALEDYVKISPKIYRRKKMEFTHSTLTSPTTPFSSTSLSMLFNPSPDSVTAPSSANCISVKES